MQALDLASQHLFGPQPLTALFDAAAAGALPRLAKLDLRFNPLTDAAAHVLPRLLSPEAAAAALTLTPTPNPNPNPSPYPNPN